MTGRKKAVNEIKRRKKEAEEKRIRIIDDLRKDGYFDKLYREINALKWDYIKTPQTQKRAETEEKISADFPGKLSSIYLNFLIRLYKSFPEINPAIVPPGKGETAPNAPNIAGRSLALIFVLITDTYSFNTAV